jgi:hypothetical protein
MREAMFFLKVVFHVLLGLLVITAALVRVKK